MLAPALRRGLGNVPNLVRALGLVWDAARGWTVAWLVLLILQGILPAASVYLTRALVNSLVAVVSSGGDPATLRPALVLGLLMGVILLLGRLLTSAAGWVRTNQGELVKDYVASLVHQQSIRLDLAFYDSPEYHDHLHRARSEASSRPVSLLESLGGLLQNGITLAAMVAILIPYGVWLPIALLVSTLPALVVVTRYRTRDHRFWRRVTPDVRRIYYYDWLLTARQTAAELRLFGVANKFRSAYQTLRQRVRTEQLRLQRDEALAGLAAGVLALLTTGGVMIYMVWQAIQGHATLGDLALFYSAFNQGQGLMRTLLDSLGQIYSNSLFLGDLFEFLALEPQVVDPIHPIAIGGAEATTVRAAGPAVRFERVSFRYPGSGGGRWVLQEFDLAIAPGQVVAIVGPNGTGKTTLIKLLCRLYDPQSGRVTLDGVDVRELRLEELRRQITVLFQEPVEYAATAAENISLDFAVPSARLQPDPPTEAREQSSSDAAADAAAVAAAAVAAGADGPIARLPRGYDTLLGTWFQDGTDLSVGEWQRIALARAFLRGAPLIILDEPTSSMDSWAEADWLARLRALISGRTAIIITHRFTTARYADVIHVMDAGHIIESGTHEELLAQDGSYARSWRRQVGPGPSKGEEE